jgi:hypothetical protein
MKNLPYPPTNSSNPLRKIIAFVTTAALIGLALMFSAVVLVAILIIGTIGAGYLWWKTRELRKQMRNFSPQGVELEGEIFESEKFSGEVIEGEAIRVDKTRDGR